MLCPARTGGVSPHEGPGGKGKARAGRHLKAAGFSQTLRLILPSILWVCASPAGLSASAQVVTVPILYATQGDGSSTCVLTVCDSLQCPDACNRAWRVPGTQ